MRILSLHPYVPHPLNRGGNFRSHETLSVLVEEHDVTFVALDERGAQATTDWPLTRRLASPPVVVSRSSCPPLTEDGRRLRTLAPRSLIGRPASVRSVDHPGLWNALASMTIERFDVVQGYGLHVLPMLVALRRSAPHIVLVLDLDDIQSAARRLAFETWPRFRPSRARVFLDWKRLARYESAHLGKVDSLWVCKEDDRQRLTSIGTRGRVEVVVNVIDCEPLDGIVSPDAPPRMLFVGDFSIAHNEDAALWFLEYVWPAVRAANPSAETWLVGLRPTPALLEAHDPSARVFVQGDVPDVRRYIATSQISIVPVRIGSGTRIKVLEAMAAGLPVVSTTLGVSGLGIVHGQDALIADTPDDFARLCLEALGDATLRQRLTTSARDLVRRRFDRPVMRATVSDIYRHLGEGVDR